MKLAYLFSALVFLAGQSAVAKPLTCPSSTSAAIQSSELAPLASVANPVDRAAMLGRIVATMRDRGVTPSGIVDGLISAYCPLVAANASLTDAQKAATIRGFASQAARAAYAFENAEEIILDVAVPPSVASAVNEKARKDKVSPESWAATAIANAVK